MRVRQAEDRDVPDILDIGKNELVPKTRFKDVKVDDVKFRRMVAMLIHNASGFAEVIVDEEDKVQGFLLGMVDELYFSKQTYATDVTFYVRERYRALSIGLIKRFVKWAKKKRVFDVEMLISSGIEMERTGQLYEHLGFEKIGGLYSMRVSK